MTVTLKCSLLILMLGTPYENLTCFTTFHDESNLSRETVEGTNVVNFLHFLTFRNQNLTTYIYYAFKKGFFLFIWITKDFQMEELTRHRKACKNMHLLTYKCNVTVFLGSWIYLMKWITAVGKNSFTSQMFCRQIIQMFTELHFNQLL